MSLLAAFPLFMAVILLLFFWWPSSYGGSAYNHGSGGGQPAAFPTLPPSPSGGGGVPDPGPGPLSPPTLHDLPPTPTPSEGLEPGPTSSDPLPEATFTPGPVVDPLASGLPESSPLPEGPPLEGPGVEPGGLVPLPSWSGGPSVTLPPLLPPPAPEPCTGELTEVATCPGDPADWSHAGRSGACVDEADGDDVLEFGLRNATQPASFLLEGTPLLDACKLENLRRAARAGSPYVDADELRAAFAGDGVQGIHLRLVPAGSEVGRANIGHIVPLGGLRLGPSQSFSEANALRSLTSGHVATFEAGAPPRRIATFGEDGCAPASRTADVARLLDRGCTGLRIYDAVVVGAGVDPTHPDLARLAPSLATWVQGGGTLVVLAPASGKGLADPGSWLRDLLARAQTNTGSAPLLRFQPGTTGTDAGHALLNLPHRLDLRSAAYQAPVALSLGGSEAAFAPVWRTTAGPVLMASNQGAFGMGAVVLAGVAPANGPLGIASDLAEARAFLGNALAQGDREHLLDFGDTREAAATSSQYAVDVRLEGGSGRLTVTWW